MINLIKNIFILLFILLATFEVCARIDDKIKWDADFFSDYSSKLLLIDDELGRHNRPNAQFEKWKINKYGFRGPEITPSKEKGVIRIAFMGASETFGLYESPNMEYPAQIRSKLNYLYPGEYEVINVSCAGMTLPKAIEYYKDWISKFSPDFVFYYPSPAVYLDVNAPHNKLNPETPNKKRGTFKLRIVGKLKNVGKELVPSRVQTYIKMKVIDNIVGKYPSGWAWESPPPDRVDLLRTHLLQLISTIRSQDCEIVLMTHANRFSIPHNPNDTAQLMSWRKFYPRASGECLISMDNAANEIIRKIGIEVKVPVVDIDKGIPKDANNFADFVHFTDAGARKVASIITSFIIHSR